MAQKVLLLILDGWGIGEPIPENAIHAAQPAFWNHLISKYPPASLTAKGRSVGLPDGCLSGSEVGHLTIGAGRVVWQNAARIERAVTSGKLSAHRVLCEARQHITKNNGRAHIVGLLSDGGIHAHVRHLKSFMSWAHEKNIPVSLHLFLDGRDMSPASALDLYSREIKGLCSGSVSLSSMCGRAIAMDRSENWDRTIEIWNLLTTNVVRTANRPEEFLQKQYREGITDEFIPPARFDSEYIKDNDTVIFFNFRADRMRQLTRLFLGLAPHAVQNTVMTPKNLFLASLTEYDQEYKNVAVLFPPEIPRNTLGETIARQGLRQLRLAESEKYAHVTYFLNGGREENFPFEDRLFIPSLGLKNYAAEPVMSLPEVTSSLVRALATGHYEFVVANIANGDMVGHSGELTAAIQAVNHVDAALNVIVSAAKKSGYTVIITADHGNIEHMVYGNEPHTAHTLNDVPFVVVDDSLRLIPTGGLHQVAPTVLQIMGLQIPEEMTSSPLLVV